MDEWHSKTFLLKVVKIAREAGAKIMEIRSGDDLGVQHKADESPVTRADMAAHEHIVSALQALTPGVHILSEESADDTAERLKQEWLWLIDPIDGTKELMAGNYDFTVNIALVHRDEPVLGVVYTPALDTIYYGASGLGAWKQAGSAPVKLAAQPIHSPLLAAISKSNHSKTLHFVNQIHAEKLSGGSSLKHCLVAEGVADLSPRLHPQNEWDVAAADAILRSIGGGIFMHKTKQLLVYNKPDLHTPDFVALVSRDLMQVW